MERDVVLPRRREGLIIESLGAETSVYDEEGRRVHVLNETAALVFEHCDGHTRRRDLLAKLLELYEGADAATLDADLEEILGQFEAESLLYPQAGAGDESA